MLIPSISPLFKILSLHVIPAVLCIPLFLASFSSTKIDSLILTREFLHLILDWSKSCSLEYQKNGPLLISFTEPRSNSWQCKAQPNYLKLTTQITLKPSLKTHTKSINRLNIPLLCSGQSWKIKVFFSWNNCLTLNRHKTLLIELNCSFVPLDFMKTSIK